MHFGEVEPHRNRSTKNTMPARAMSQLPSVSSVVTTSSQARESWHDGDGAAHATELHGSGNPRGLLKMTGQDDVLEGLRYRQTLPFSDSTAGQNNSSCPCCEAWQRHPRLMFPRNFKCAHVYSPHTIEDSCRTARPSACSCGAMIGRRQRECST